VHTACVCKLTRNANTMKGSLLVLAVFVFAFAPATATAAATAPLTAFQELLVKWSPVRDFSVTIDAFEASGARTQSQRLHYEFRTPEHARLEILDGPARGSIVVWNGTGQKATAFHRGFGLFKLRADVRDPRLTSLRGNGVLTPNFGPLIDCFAAHRSHISEMSGPKVEDESTEAIVLAYAGFTCPNDSADDRDVTRDVLYVAHSSGFPVLRERFAGETLVERWILHDLKVDVELCDEPFR